MISSIVITRNEEMNIAACLDTLTWTDEIIIVDAFSEDRTVQLAQNYPVRLYQRPWPGFSAQRSYALSLATHPWVLFVDADERISPALAAEIRSRTGDPGDYDGFLIPRRNFFLGKWIRNAGWYPDYQLRLFRADLARFTDREAHEHAVVDGAVGRLVEPIIHYSYRDLDHYLRKLIYTTSLEAREMQKQNSRFSFRECLTRTFFTFQDMFFQRRGYRDGMHGFLVCALSAFYVFLSHAKLWELSLSEGREDQPCI